MVLFLSDIAGSEVLLILLFILMFFGSKSIPGIARTFGRTIRQIKDASQDLQDEIRKSTQDMKGDLNLKGIMEETVQDIEKPFEEYASDLDESIKFDSTQTQRNNYFVQKQLEEQKQLEDLKKAGSSVPLDQQHLEE
ncbi:MAG: twin-arginine translocase TatA/TatE family subunit [Bacteroidota bacterium]